MVFTPYVCFIGHLIYSVYLLKKCVADFHARGSGRIVDNGCVFVGWFLVYIAV
jgi:hypothetical protein